LNYRDNFHGKTMGICPFWSCQNGGRFLVVYKKETTTKDRQDTMKPNNNESISILPLSICYSEKRGSAPLSLSLSLVFCLLFHKSHWFLPSKTVSLSSVFHFFACVSLLGLVFFFLFGNILDRLGEYYIRPKKLLVYIYFFILSWIIQNLPGICY